MPDDALESPPGLQQEEAGEIRSDGEDGSLLREVGRVHLGFLRCARHEEAGERNEESEGVGFLLHAVEGLGVELALAQIVALLDLVELLQEPAQVVEVVQILGRVRRIEEVGHQDERFLLAPCSVHEADGDGIEAAREVAVRGDGDDLVRLAALDEALDFLEGLARAHPDHEVDRPLHQLPDEEEGGIACVEQEDITGPESWQHAKEFPPFRAVGGGHGEVVDDTADHLVEGGEEHLGAVPDLGAAESVPELITSLRGDPGRIGGEDSMPSPSEGVPVHLVEAVGDLVEKRTDELGGDLLPGLAESGRGDGSLCREWDLVVAALVPEGIEKGLVAASPGVGDQVEEESDDEFEGEWAAPGEVLLTLSEDTRFDGGQEPGECSKILNDSAGTGMGIADRFLCRSCWISFYCFESS